MRYSVAKRIMAFLLVSVFVLGLFAGMHTEEANAATKVGKAKITVKADNENKTATITIAKTQNADGYKIMVKKPGAKKYTKLATVKKDGAVERTYTATDLSAGKYSFKVRAYKTSGKKKVWGKYSKPVTVKIKQKKDDDANTGEITNVLILYPGEETPAMKSFINDQLNPRLEKEIGINVRLHYISWDVYWDQKEILLDKEEPIDLYWDGLYVLPAIVKNNQAQPIGDLVKEYCPDMLKVIPESQLAGGMIDGELYGIPSAYTPSSSLLQLVCVRQDILEGVGMSGIRNADDLKAFAKKAADKYPNMKGPADVIYKPLTRYFSNEQYTWTTLGDAIVYGEDTRKAYSYFETEAFKQVAKFNQSMYEEGLYGDELTTNFNEAFTRMQNGDYLWIEASPGTDNEIRGAVRSKAPGAELKSYLLNPDDDKYITSCGDEVLCIPRSARNPEGALKFINWLYKSQENYLFCLYGPEDENYTIENGRIVFKDPVFVGYFSEWMFRNVNYMMFTPDVSKEYIKTYKAWDDNVLMSDVIGFHFDNSNVWSLEMAINEVINQRFVPIMCGFVDFDTYYGSAVQALKEAGIDEYVAEVQRQLDEYFKVNGYRH